MVKISCFFNSKEDLPHFLKVNQSVFPVKVDTAFNTPGSGLRPGARPLRTKEDVLWGRCIPGWSADRTRRLLGELCLGSQCGTREWGGQWHDLIKIQHTPSSVRKSVQQNPTQHETQRLSAELRAQLSRLLPGRGGRCKQLVLILGPYLVLGKDLRLHRPRGLPRRTVDGFQLP